MANNKKIVVVTGPTCTGKSSLAMELAQAFDGEIVNADAMQVYRLFDIGTAKPTVAERALVPHHVIDIIDPSGDFNASLFQAAADTAIDGILGRGRVPVVVGGTGLYIKALLYGLSLAKGDLSVRTGLKEKYVKDPLSLYETLKEVDPRYAAKVSHRDGVRIVRALEIRHVTGVRASEWEEIHGFRERRYAFLKIGLDRPRSQLYDSINKRVEAMIAAGWIEEVAGLLDQGLVEDAKPFSGIGYREIVLYIKGIVSYEDMMERIKTQTRHYAKRQLTWFRRETDLTWYRYPEELDRVREKVAEFLIPWN
jgi:tRNA dimethylallyltransferase